MTSPNKRRFIVDPKLSDAFMGLHLFTMRNSKGSYVIPSTKSFVGSHQIKKISCDDEASCTILPIESLEMLTSLFNEYQEACLFSIVPLKSVAERTLALVIESKEDSPVFDIRLGLDIYPEQVEQNQEEKVLEEISSTNSNTVPIDSSNCCNFPAMESVKAMTFFLCSEDVNFLLDPKNVELLSIVNMHTRYLLMPYENEVPRRTSAVLGQDFLSRDGRYWQCSHWASEVLYGHQDSQVRELYLVSDEGDW